MAQNPLIGVFTLKIPESWAVFHGWKHIKRLRMFNPSGRSNCKTRDGSLAAMWPRNSLDTLLDAANLVWFDEDLFVNQPKSARPRLAQLGRVWRIREEDYHIVSEEKKEGLICCRGVLLRLKNCYSQLISLPLATIVRYRKSGANPNSHITQNIVPQLERAKSKKLELYARRLTKPGFGYLNHYVWGTSENDIQMDCIAKLRCTCTSTYRWDFVEIKPACLTLFSD